MLLDQAARQRFCFTLRTGFQQQLAALLQVFPSIRARGETGKQGDCIGVQTRRDLRFGELEYGGRIFRRTLDDMLEKRHRFTGATAIEQEHAKIEARVVVVCVCSERLSVGIGGNAEVAFGFVPIA